MASSESPSSSSSSPLTIDDLEGLEDMEFDPNTLRELLYEPMESGKETMEEVGVGVESWWGGLDEYEEGDGTGGLKWMDLVMEEACNEMGVWCAEEVSEYEFMEFSQNGIVCDEIGYIGLWQEDS